MTRVGHEDVPQGSRHPRVPPTRPRLPSRIVFVRGLIKLASPYAGKTRRRTCKREEASRARDEPSRVSLPYATPSSIEGTGIAGLPIGLDVAPLRRRAICTRASATLFSLLEPTSRLQRRLAIACLRCVVVDKLTNQQPPYRASCFSPLESAIEFHFGTPSFWSEGKYVCMYTVFSRAGRKFVGQTSLRN